MRLAQKKVWFLLLAVFFLVTFLIPSTREAHLLCFRLLLPLNGKTFVQGQPPETAVDTIPNVQFSERYRRELVQNAGRTPDDFALAMATMDRYELRTPPVALWTNHPLLEWAALTCPWVQMAPNRTNAYDTNGVLELVRLAQKADTTNGALWLAEAFVSFEAGQDRVAIDALRTAAKQKDWRAGSERDLLYLSALYEKAGLSKLDALVAADDALPFWFSLGIQGRIQRHLQRLMAEAVSTTNDNRFSEILSLVVELRKADWLGANTELRNTFRSFTAGEDLTEAMRKRMKLAAEPPSDRDERREFRKKVFIDYLNAQPEKAVISRFLGQADVAETEKGLRNRLFDETFFHHRLSALLHANLAGGYSALNLWFLSVAILLTLPFAALKRSGYRPGTFPKQLKFWIFAVMMLAVSVLVGRHFLHAIGWFENRQAASVTEQLLSAPVLSGLWAFAMLTFWIAGKKPLRYWLVTALFAAIYLCLIVAMAYFRIQAGKAIIAGI